MQPIEVKFLFEGIIFSSNVFVERISNSFNRYEFSIRFLSNYLSKKFSDCYFFVLENNKFKPIYIKNVKEEELIRIVQNEIYNLFESIKEKFT